MHKAYHHSARKTSQKKIVMEGGITKLIEDLAVLDLDQSERHIFNVEEAMSKFTFDQQSSYRSR